MDDADGGGEVSPRGTDDVESDPTLREIQDHVLTGHASFLSWCAACVRRRGRAERDIVVLATKKMRMVPKIPVLS